jgi:hypothetical protein
MIAHDNERSFNAFERAQHALRVSKVASDHLNAGVSDGKLGRITH